MGYIELVRATLAAPIYISVAWSLIVSYQLFTQTAVHSVAVFLDGLGTGVGGFLLPNIGIFAFIHAFAWIFVLSSVIPSIILGKGRSVLVQFLLCLTLALVATSIGGFLELLIGVNLTTQLQASSTWLTNPIAASLYLSAPYVLMLYIDLRSKIRQQKTEELLGADAAFAVDQAPTGEKFEECRPEVSSPKKEHGQALQVRSRISYLHGTGVVCLLIAAFTLWIGNFILTAPHVILNATVQMAFAAILLWLGYSRDGVMVSVSHQQDEGSVSETMYKGETKAPPEWSSPSEIETPSNLAEKIADPHETAEHVRGVAFPVGRFCVRRPKYIVDSQC